jgi:hypothetical protein
LEHKNFNKWDTSSMWKMSFIFDSWLRSLSLTTFKLGGRSDFSFRELNEPSYKASASYPVCYMNNPVIPKVPWTSLDIWPSKGRTFTGPNHFLNILVKQSKWNKNSAYPFPFPKFKIESRTITWTCTCLSNCKYLHLHYH